MGGHTLNYEIEFHPVGDGTKAGDAITIRYGQPGQYKVMVVDGGTEDSGNAIVKHIQSVYGADTVISDIVSTHPDTDHCSGLRVILKDLPVERLWVHGLWHHAANMLNLFADGRWTQEGLAQAIRKEYSIVEELITLASDKGAKVYEPFAGEKIGPFTVLSPTKEVYRHLVPQFRRTPEPNQEVLESRNIWLGDAHKGGFTGLLKSLVEAVTNWIPETWNNEKLKEGAVTAAENETSTVLYGDFGDSVVLLTGDAGVNALNWATDNATSLGLDISKSRLIQVPHHGSRSNVTPSLLNRLIGPIQPENSPEKKIAIVSAPKDDAKHPRKMVLNAFKRRGAGVRSTQGVRYRYHSGMPPRTGENTAEVFDLFTNVEAYD